MKYRLLSLFLALLMLCSMLASCSGDGDQDQTTTAGTTDLPETEAPDDTGLSAEQIDAIVENYNYMLSSQTFTAPYQFDKNISEWADAAIALKSLGTNHVKFAADSLQAVQLRLDHVQFKYVFLWFRNVTPYYDQNFTEQEKKTEYQETYYFVKQLLKTYNNTGMEFFIGNWEGDWIYLNGDASIQKMPKAITEGMIEWYNIRQQAIEDALKDTPHENVTVWQYMEINRAVDVVFGNDPDRLLNRVLPYTNVDFVSYSAYDVQSWSEGDIAKVIDTIEKAMKPKPEIEGSRVFIGEMGFTGESGAGIPSAQRNLNLQAFAKFLKCNIKFILYWETLGVSYDEQGKQSGHGLIAADGSKTDLAKCLESLLVRGKTYVRDYVTENGRAPTEAEYRAFLLTTPELSAWA